MGQAMSLPRFLPQGDDRDLRRGWPRSRISVGQHYTSGRPQVVYLSFCPWESAGLIKEGDMGIVAFDCRSVCTIDRKK